MNKSIRHMRVAAFAFATIFLISAASAEVVSEDDFQPAGGQSDSSGNWHPLSGNSSERGRTISASVPRKSGSKPGVVPDAPANGTPGTDVQAFEDQQMPGEDWQSQPPGGSAAPKAATQLQQTPPFLAHRTQAIAAPIAMVPVVAVAAASSQRAAKPSPSESTTPALVPAAIAQAVLPADTGESVTEKRSFSLVAGEPLESQLMVWANRVGWKVLWNLPDDNNWIVPGDESCGMDFEAAVRHVIEELASNGADVVGDSWRGNHTIVITQSGATEQ